MKSKVLMGVPGAQVTKVQGQLKGDNTVLASADKRISRLAMGFANLLI